MNTHESIIHSLSVSELQNKKIRSIIDDIVAKYTTPEDYFFLEKARVYANELPFEVLEKINSLRINEKAQRGLLIRGLDVSQGNLEKTPSAVNKDLDVTSAIREGFLIVLMASYLGDVFGWSTQRDGALINNIIPIANHENEQLSTGSTTALDWHTEEAFHPFRADCIGLFCLRNEDQVPTVLGSIDSIDLDVSMKKILFEERFIFLTDKNFTYDENKSYSSILFGDFDSPYLRIDPSFMKTVKGDHEAQTALDYIIKKLQSTLFEVVLKPGDFILLDNYKIVHGRKAFKPKFNGYDRWLKRVNITFDIRKSREIRNSSHVIETN